MKLACLYQEGSQLELLGDPSSLLALGDSLNAANVYLDVELVRVPVETWDGALQTLAVEVTSGPVAIRHDGQTVMVTGGAEQLALLGRNISWFAEHADTADPTDHIHLEHIRDSDHYLAADALPLIVRLIGRSR